MSLDKPRVIQAIQAVLAEALEAVERVAEMARNETTSGETRSDGQYDTRATEASYLARGQAWRIAELRKLSAWFEIFDGEADLDPPTVRVGALVQLDGDHQEVVFIAPIGGTRAEVSGTTVRVISPASPLGSAMVDLEVGDAFEVDTPRGLLTYEVVSVT